jgi:D-3-phosphoglycerate dehydrogenase
MKNHKVFVTLAIPKVAVDRVAQIAEVKLSPYGVPCPRDMLMKELAEAEAVIADGRTIFDAEAMKAAQKLKIVARIGVGLDNVDIKAATERGVYVSNTPGVLSDAVAELTIGLMLALSRRLLQAHAYVESGKWTELSSFPLGIDLSGKTLGIIGLGQIGMEVARRASGLRMAILYHDTVRREDAKRLYHAKYSSLEDLLKDSDFITLHVPLTSRTEKLIGHSELGLMKPTAYLINTARGNVVDQAALWKALKERRIAGAALDVCEVEPIRHDDPLLQLDNVILTPHIGSGTVETRTKMALTVADDIIRVLKGEKPMNLVNRELLEKRQTLSQGLRRE